jgi:primosomal replication protein N
VSRNRIELIGIVLAVPELRTTPAGTSILRIEVSSGEGPDTLRLGIVMTGTKADELVSRMGAGATIGTGATIKVTGELRPARERRGPLARPEVEVLAQEIVELSPGAGSV